LFHLQVVIGQLEVELVSQPLVPPDDTVVPHIVVLVVHRDHQHSRLNLFFHLLGFVIFFHLLDYRLVLRLPLPHLLLDLVGVERERFLDGHFLDVLIGQTSLRH